MESVSICKLFQVQDEFEIMKWGQSQAILKYSRTSLSQGIWDIEYMSNLKSQLQVKSLDKSPSQVSVIQNKSKWVPISLKSFRPNLSSF